MKKRDLLSIGDLSVEEINGILDLGRKVKKDKAAYADALKGKSIGLIFQKPSNRTRVSFEIGMVQLGGYAIYLGPSEIGMGGRESVKDVAKVLSRYLDCLVARTYKHADVEDLAMHATVPVINGLSDYAHPCQALSDIFTIKEKFGTLRFYIGGVEHKLADKIYKLIERAEQESVVTCEMCGTKDKVTTKGSWILTLCNSCRKNRK